MPLATSRTPTGSSVSSTPGSAHGFGQHAGHSQRTTTAGWPAGSMRGGVLPQALRDCLSLSAGGYPRTPCSPRFTSSARCSISTPTAVLVPAPQLHPDTPSHWGLGRHKNGQSGALQHVRRVLKVQVRFLKVRCISTTSVEMQRRLRKHAGHLLSLIHISEPTRLGMISYAVFCLKKKKKQNTDQHENEKQHKQNTRDKQHKNH